MSFRWSGLPPKCCGSLGFILVPQPSFVSSRTAPAEEGEKPIDGSDEASFQGSPLSLAKGREPGCSLPSLARFPPPFSPPQVGADNKACGSRQGLD